MLDLTKSQPDTVFWPQYVRRPRNYRVTNLRRADFGALSDTELDILDSVFQQFGSQTQWELVDYTHTLPEWCDPGSSSCDIDPADILRDASYSEAQITEASDLTHAQLALPRLLGK